METMAALAAHFEQMGQPEAARPSPKITPASPP